MAGLDRDKLREVLKARELTPRALSRAVGDNPYLVRDILAGKSQNPRSDTMSKLAEHLGVQLFELMSGDGEGPPASADPRLVPKFLVVRHQVQAGTWIETDQLAQVYPGPDRPVIPDPRFANCAQWLEEVVGDSIDLRIPPGGFAHVVNAIDLRYEARTGDYVVVERRRDGGHLRERTIKQLEVCADGSLKLWGRSTNPKWAEPLIWSGDGDESIEVEIVGLVIGSYSSFI